MAPQDAARSVERNRLIFSQLIKNLPAVEREKHLARHNDDLQRSIDAVLQSLGSGPPSARERIATPAPISAAAPGPVIETPPTSIVAPTPASCSHVRDAVERADASSVPGAIRAVLTTEDKGLTPHAIAEGVRILRPGTEDSLVHGALHQMRKRGELAREGFHKNYKYHLVPVSSLGSGVVVVTTAVANQNARGGAAQ